MQQLVLVSQKAEAVAVMLRASHIPLYGLSVGEPEELSGLILSLESTCQDLFATGYFESDISDDPLTLGWRRNASAIVFHYRGERARTPDGYVEMGK